jgi:hypothetical protein
MIDRPAGARNAAATPETHQREIAEARAAYDARVATV